MIKTNFKMGFDSSIMVSNYSDNFQILKDSDKSKFI